MASESPRSARNLRYRVRRAIGRLISKLDGEDVVERARQILADADGFRQRAQRVDQQLTALNADLQEARRDPASHDISDLERRSDELQAETQRLKAAVPTEDQLARLNTDLDRVYARRLRFTRRAAQFTFAIQVIVAASVIVVPRESAKTAAATHLDYYSAVATIAPVLLIAGFVELAIIGPSLPVNVIWYLLSFATGPILAGWAALDVLATHKSTPTTDSLTSWGLVTAVFALLLFVGVHATMPRKN